MNKRDAQQARRFKRQARSQFDDWASSYDRSLLNHFLFRPAYIAMLEQIALWRREHPRAFSVLDIGCGTATFAGLLAHSDWPVTTVGLDYSPQMCAQANEKARRWSCGHIPSFVGGDSEHLPFAVASFDIVTCANSFHHYPHQQTVVEEMRRVLRCGGRLVLVDGFRDNVVGRFIYDTVIERVERDVHHASWQEIDGYCQSAGFTRIQRCKTGLLFPLLVTTATAE